MVLFCLELTEQVSLRLGDIVLSDSYEALGSHYMTAIMPAGVKNPKHKASVEGNIGKIATADTSGAPRRTDQIGLAEHSIAAQ